MNQNHLAIASVPMQNWGELYSEKDALHSGTIFKDLDMPFFAVAGEEKKCCCGVEPKSSQEMERQQIMGQITKTGFFLDDLTLFLDTHPAETDALKLYWELSQRHRELKANFAEKFYPLSRNCITDSEEQKEFCWTDGPAPWEGALI